MLKKARVILYAFLILGVLFLAAPAAAVSRCSAPDHHASARCHHHCRTHGYNEACNNCLREDEFFPPDQPESKSRRSGAQSATLAALSVHPGDRCLNPMLGSSPARGFRAKVFCLTRSYRI